MIRTESWVKNRDTNRIVGLVYRYSPNRLPWFLHISIGQRKNLVGQPLLLTLKLIVLPLLHLLLMHFECKGHFIFFRNFFCLFVMYVCMFIKNKFCNNQLFRTFDMMKIQIWTFECRLWAPSVYRHALCQLCHWMQVILYVRTHSVNLPHAKISSTSKIVALSKLISELAAGFFME